MSYDRLSDVVPNLQVKVVLGVMVFFLLGNVGVNTLHAEVSLEAIKQIESGGRADAIGDNGDSVGLYQISYICLKEYNIYHIKAPISPAELRSPESNRKVAEWYVGVRIPQMLKARGHSVTIHHILIAYNCGISCLDRTSLPSTTIRYLAKYEQLTGEQL